MIFFFLPPPEGYEPPSAKEMLISFVCWILSLVIGACLGLWAMYSVYETDLWDLHPILGVLTFIVSVIVSVGLLEKAANKIFNKPQAPNGLHWLKAEMDNDKDYYNDSNGPDMQVFNHHPLCREYRRIDGRVYAEILDENGSPDIWRARFVYGKTFEAPHSQFYSMNEFVQYIEDLPQSKS